MNDLRIGDSDREAAAQRLGEHAAAGRLDVDELERRLERAGKAVYATDLAALERDLPSLTPDRPRRSLRMHAPPWPTFPLLIAACIAIGVATTIAIGHPIFPFFPLVAFFLWRRLWFTRGAFRV